MNTQAASQHRARAEEFQREHRTELVTLVFTDIVGSTALKQQIGDRQAVALMQKHHAIVRALLAGFVGAREISTAGDSFFLVFSTPSGAVKFALLLLSRLRELAQETSHAPADRVGIHVGEVVIEEEAGAANPKDFYGIHVDTCARVMGLASANQILLTRSAFDNARAALRGEDVPGVSALRWANHGPYLLKGVEEPVEICEVRATEGPLTPPTASEKAQRHRSGDAEPVLGWRPALDQIVPNTQWVLEKKLGEGGFGEVWLGRHQKLKERRVFKFCFRADRVRSLKREMTLFRVLKERVGDHPNIVRLLEVYFEEPPFYVVMDHVEGQDLKAWCEQQGGVDKVPLTARLEIVAQIADALQAAHDAGVIHRDVKPGNILVSNPKSEIRNPKSEDSQPSTLNLQPSAKLTDFGIGQVVSEEALKGVTKAGFTQTILADSSSSQTGSQMYMAPELLAGKPASTRSDIYSLGVVLYQLLVGDFTRPLTTDWTDHIADPLLRDDLKHCFAGNPQDRFPGAGQLAKNLRGLPKRRAALEQQQAELAARERAAYRRGIVRTAGLAAVIVALVSGLAVVAFRQSQRADKGEVEARHLLYVANLNVAELAWERNNIGRLRQLLNDTRDSPYRGFEWFYWQRQTHLPFKTLRGHVTTVTSVAFSPDGQRIVTGSRDKTAKVWEVSSGRELLTLKGHTHEIWSVAFSLDGQRIVTGSWDQTAKVWEAASGRELLTLKGHTAPIKSVAFSHDGQWIVTGSEDRTAKVWDAATAKERRTLEGHTDKVRSVAFSSDGQRILTGSLDTTAKVWDAATGKELLILKHHTNAISYAALSADGQRIATGSRDKTVKVWDAATGKELRTLKGHNGYVSSVAFSPDGQRLVTASADQTAKVWEVASGEELFTLKGHITGILSVAFSRDGQRIVTGSEDQTAKLWDAATSREVVIIRGHTGQIRSVAFSPDGERIVSGSWDRTARVWEAASGRELLRLEGHSGLVLSVAFSPDGQRIVTGSWDQTAKVWDAATGKELFTLKGHTDGILPVAFSPDSLRIVTGSWDQTAKVWDAVTGKELLTLKGHSAGIWSVAFSPDGQRIVTGSEDKTARVWEAASGRELLTFKGHTDEIESVAFSPDGHRIVTGSDDKTAKVWEAVSGRELLTLKGHSDVLRSVAFSPDGKRIVTGSNDQTAKVWEASSGLDLLTLMGHSAWVWSVAFSPDGQRIVTGSEDHTAMVWEAATPQQVAAWQAEEWEATK